MKGRIEESAVGYSEAHAAQEMKEFGARFGRACDVIGTRQAAATAIGISIAALHRYVAGSVIPAFDVCKRLCEQTRVRMGWLAFNTGPMLETEEELARLRDSHLARQERVELDVGMLAKAKRIADEVLKKYGLRDKLNDEQFAELQKIVYNDLMRGAADDKAQASLDRILAISRKS